MNNQDRKGGIFTAFCILMCLSLTFIYYTNSSSVMVVVVAF